MEVFSGRILVVGPTPTTAGALSARLSRYGVTTSTAAGEAAALNHLRHHRFDGLVLDAQGRDDFAVAALVSNLRQATLPHIVPVLVIVESGASASETQNVADVVLRGVLHPAQICARLQLARRVVVMEDEARLRARTLREFDQSVDLSLDRTDYRAPQILFIGRPTPFFLGLERAVRQSGGTITAAFSTFTAFDYLHERDFDAVVCNGIEGIEPVYVIANAFRRNSRLFHTPLCLFIDLDDFDELEKAFESGFSDILDARGDPRDMSGRVMSLARERRRREAVKAAFASIRHHRVSEKQTGLATQDFFHAHLERMIVHNAHTGRALSLILVEARAPHQIADRDVQRALVQLGGMISHLIRAEDLAARLDDNTFVIAMPGASQSAAQSSCERLEAIASCTAFDSGALMTPFQLMLRTSFVERLADEAGNHMLRRALTQFGGATSASH